MNRRLVFVVSALLICFFAEEAWACNRCIIQNRIRYRASNCRCLTTGCCFCPVRCIPAANPIVFQPAAIIPLPAIVPQPAIPFAPPGTVVRFRQESYTVMVPQTRTITDNYTIQVPETVTKQVPYTVMTPDGPRTYYRTQTSTRMRSEVRTRDRQYTVMVPETRTRSVPYLVSVPTVEGEATAANYRGADAISMQKLAEMLKLAIAQALGVDRSQVTASSPVGKTVKLTTTRSGTVPIEYTINAEIENPVDLRNVKIRLTSTDRNDDAFQLAQDIVDELTGSAEPSDTGSIESALERTWTERETGRKIRAQFVRKDGDRVVLRRSNDGILGSVSLESLSGPDIEYVASELPIKR